MTTALEKSAEKLKQWCIEKALPFWAETGRFPDGSWVEHLYLDGTPDKMAERRWRVLARQVYVYATASQLGWYDGLEIARSTYQVMRDKGHNRLLDGAYVHRILPDGTITNDLHDFYDHAFYLLASASLYRATQDEKYLFHAYEVRTFVDSQLKATNGGWHESFPLTAGALRRQNPHMHWLEANMALYKASGEIADLKAAHMVFSLFKKTFFNSKTHRIREFFAPDWQTAPSPKGDSAEPGHAAEWIWLLGEYKKLSGVVIDHYAFALYETLHRQRGPYLNDEEDQTGGVRRETKRLWVQTEVIKAHLAMAERGQPGASDCAAALIDGLFELYLNFDGTWNDQLNACGVNVAKTIPVSTFYHILCMASEASRVSKLGH